MVAQRNVLILFMELKDLSTLGVVTAIVKKKKSVRMKKMLEFNSASKKSSVVVNVLEKFCSPDQRAFKRMLDDKVITRSNFVLILWN